MEFEQFIVDNLLHFPTDDLHQEEQETDVTSTAVNTCNSTTLAGDLSCRSFVDTQFSNLCVPYDDLAEFEWLSNFVEESFSNEDLQKLQLISGLKARSENGTKNRQFQIRPAINRTDYNPVFNINMMVPGKARTKRSRAASCNWASPLLINSPTVTGPIPTTSLNFTSTSIEKKNVKKEFDDNSNNEDGRKCVHCATDKTPQWRSGPMGPKTLCNACGVRYKSGRLVPEYRPAASPTFILTKHSNSHRKVLELRRQKQMQSVPQFIDHQNINDDYLIPQHIGPDYRQLI
ncbi:GATA transcription factor 12-like [Cynara cardunculus var. scolymus]|uniref:GATA transcription factor n=1 Tax=Cynara cardunculus var. scolymus TaxID=59895 RepID=A0A118JTR9_CYNCS|nr:GATA transcription factor 12-like [Cynara cardunculus var. scolymus]KVH90339.1 Transcription factor, GATA, plant [Cynara cardunculus var. scolymus]